LWFHVGEVVVPPRNLSELSAALNRAQRRGLDRSIAGRADVGALERSGGVDLIMFRWDSEEVRHLLIVALGGTGVGADALVLRDGPIDERSLLLRSGPAASALRQRSAVVFGAGAVGGHAAVCLASSGLGRLRLVDSDQVVPGNAVRHVVGHRGVGVPKAYAVQVQVNEHAPWTKVETVVEQPITPTRLRELIGDVDLVIDATGTEAVTGALSATAAAVAKPLVSGALYRGGAIARVRRQGMPGDVAFAERADSEYRLIPTGGDDELVEPAVGCSAAANNAPPASVIACAALVAQAAVDVLSGTCVLPDEMTDVYRALVGEAPYDVVGRVR
jgi:molybdopterin/thiamine biosynthesis adenylyltransferase